MTCLHATEPASVYLSAFARAEAIVADVDRALYDDRTVVKQLAMRRTLFAFPRDLLPAAWGAPRRGWSRSCATRLAKEVEANGIGRRRSRLARRHVRRDAAQPARRRSADHGRAARADPGPRRRVSSWPPGKAYGGSFPIAPRVLGTLGAGGSDRARRATRATGERSPARTLDADRGVARRGRRDPPTTDAGYRVAGRRWLRTFGPGTEADVVWWLGATKGAVRRALADLGAVEVGLEDGARDTCFPTTSTTCPSPEPWAALLPVLDPTTMGWKQRDFYLDRRRTCRTCSTPTATPAPPRGGTAGSSAAGCRTTTAWCWWSSGTTSAPTAPAALARRGGPADGVARRQRVASVLRVRADAVRALIAPEPATSIRLGCLVPGQQKDNQPEQRPPPVQRLRMRYAKRGRLTVHQPPGLQPRLRAGGLPGADPDGLLLGLQPAPADLLRRCLADRRGERGGVPRDRPRRGGRPGIGHAPTSTRRCPRASTWSRWSPSAGGSIADRLEASWWRLTLDEPGPDEAPARRVEQLARDRRGDGRADDQEGRSAASTPGRRSCRPRSQKAPADRPSCAILDVVLRHGSPSVRPDDVLAALHGTSGLTRHRRSPAAIGAGTSGSRGRHGG